MNNRAALLCAILLVLLLYGDEVPAQSVPFSNLCQTQIGICPSFRAPVGSSCRCGNDQGRIIFPPPNWNNACGTRHGVCIVNFAPMGSPCSCSNDPGQIIRR